MSEPKFKIGDKVRVFNIPGFNVTSKSNEGVIANIRDGVYFVTLTNGVMVFARGRDLEPTEDTKKFGEGILSLSDCIGWRGNTGLGGRVLKIPGVKKRKKITIQTRREKNGYRVLEVDALSHHELPDEYLDGCPRAYLASDLAGGRLDVFDKENALDFITAGFLYSPPELLKLKAICAAAGKRLHDINKRKREEAKIETWEW